jgi:hypothetical protein
MRNCVKTIGSDDRTDTDRLEKNIESRMTRHTRPHESRAASIEAVRSTAPLFIDRSTRNSLARNRREVALGVALTDVEVKLRVALGHLSIEGQQVWAGGTSKSVQNVGTQALYQ